MVPLAALVQVVGPYHPRAKTGRLPFGIEAIHCIHYLQRWFPLSDPAMEQTLHDMLVFWEFAKPNEGATRAARRDHAPEVPSTTGESRPGRRHAVVNDIRKPKRLMMMKGTVVDAALKQARKGIQWYFRMKEHIGLDAHSGLVHSRRGHVGQRYTGTRPARFCMARKKPPSATRDIRACTSASKRKGRTGT